jgi:hypothetical protein
MRIPLPPPPEMARHGRDLGPCCRLLGLDLIAHGGDRTGIGSDEDDAGLGQRLGKGLALGKEAVARMHGLRPALLAGCDDLVDQKIALGGRRRADQHRLIGHFHMERIAIGLGIDRDRLDAHPPRGLDDPAGDLAAIGDQDSLEHVLGGPPSKPALWICGVVAKKSIEAVG